jgi:predicted nucleic acid-binding protein
MVYLDTSVVVAMMTAEKTAADIFAWYGSLTQAPVSSDWLITEFSSALSIKIQTGQLSQELAARAQAVFAEFSHNGVHLLGLGRHIYDKAAHLIKSDPFGLRAGDALHMAVAVEAGATEMATLDRRLAQSAAHNGLALVQFV